MASPSGRSLLGSKQLSVSLVDCLRTPADLRPDLRLVDMRESLQRHNITRLVPAAVWDGQDSSDEPSVLALKGLSVCLVDCMKTAALNGHLVHLAESRQRGGGIKVESEEEDKRQVNWEAEQQPDVAAERSLFKEEEKEESDELQASHSAADGRLLLIQKDGGEVTWLAQDYKLPESLNTAALGSSEGRQEEADATSQSVTTPERHGAEGVEASEPGGGGKFQQGGASKARHHRCEHCGKFFVRRSNVIRHQRRHCSTTRVRPSQPESEQTEQDTYSCNRCSLAFRTKRHLRLHVCIHTENGENHEEKEVSGEAQRERRHACKQCDKSFFLLHTLRQHLLTHTGEKPYSCEVCGKQFGRDGTRREHQLVHTGEKPFKCERCGKTCARRGDLKIHMLSHSEERPHSCSYCSKSFKQLAKLKQHERVHTGEKPYRCKFCPKQFRIQISLAAHQYTHSGEKPFKCTLCPKAFSIKNNLKKHKMIHTGEKPHRCSHCGKSCRLLQHLVVHERSHTGEKPYKCDKCGKGYSHPSGLKTHQSSHEEKPPRCSLCGLVFAGLAELSCHECGETAEKPHRCSQCGKCFSQTVNLKKHQLIHTGEKPYDCKVCGKQFNDKSNLTKHIRIHTGEKPYECEHCKRGFRLLQHLTNHRLTHSKKD